MDVQCIHQAIIIAAAQESPVTRDRNTRCIHRADVIGTGYSVTIDVRITNIAITVTFPASFVCLPMMK